MLTNNNTSSNRAASRKTRVYVFREFVLQKYYYGSKCLKAGDVVLDVAGGKGDLSWLLRNFDGIDSIVADPRRTTKNYIEKSVQYLRTHPNEAHQRAVPGLPTYQPLAGLIHQLDEVEKFVSPRHLRILVDNDLVTAVKSFKEAATNDGHGGDNWIQYWNGARLKAQKCQTTSADDDCVSYQIINALDALKTILSAKLVLGFHPDQATDSCLDLAEVLGVPFCVVPCCVFPKEFPNRILPNGTTQVKRYLQLIQYLESKYQNIQKDFLNFDFTETAKNIVLFTTTHFTE
mmetsp:Transcript_22865/g.26065  ORF Transcript_22865/g.26065 Transcript_22865/m.26065 type:complete len:289 (-) Transcript_22865:350-1216(-)